MEKPKSRHIWRCVKYYLKVSLAKGQSSYTIRGKASGLKRFFKWCLPKGVRYIDDINLELMDDYLEYLNSYRKPLDGEPLSKAQKRNLLTFVKTFVKTLYTKEVLSKHPLEHLELPSRGRQLPKALFSVDEIERILSQTLLFGMKGLRDRVILETFFASGIRRTELTFLELEDIDFNEQLLRINHGKGEKERIVPISKRACEWIAFYISKVRPMFTYIASTKALFLDNKGKQYIPNKLSDMASGYVKLAGINRRGSCYLFRHATATTMLDNGADLRHVQEMLGHASINTTQIYTHVSRNKLSGVYKGSHPSARKDSGLFD
jgi:integrase/recombinase XerD